MPQRINIVGDLGTTKVASDSYDIDNIYLTEEGWVYRHFKSTDQSRWWDEILVAGQVVEAGNEPCAETNPPKLGTIAAPTFETGGDSEFDWEYSEHQVTGTPGTYTTKVVATGGGVPTFDNTPAPPDAPSTIGAVTVTGPTNIDLAPGATGSYTVSYAGDAGSDKVAYKWTGADGARVVGFDTLASATFAFDGPGGTVATVTCTITATDASVTDGPTAGNIAITQTAVGPVGGVTISAGGTGYSTASGVATTGGSGTNFTVDITDTAGAVTGALVGAAGDGYKVGDVLTITGGNGDATVTVASLA